ncbi:hypothetical protein [Bacillus sp. 2205SS5-2]|uniref:hypothetical protein n=1 Tax=Bacillus sp. 2205SS5-2 TaxID=3109031 RepID=UPI003006D924
MLLTCTKCFHQQESGKFCGKCGTALTLKNENETPQSAQEEVAATTYNNQQSKQMSNNLKKAKEGVSRYGSFVVDVLKRPSAALTGHDRNFVNGLITIAVFILAFSLSLYFLMNKIFKSVMGGFGNFFGEAMAPQSLPAFDIVSQLFIFSLLFIAGAMLSAFAAIKLMSDSMTFKEMIGNFGSVIIPFTSLNVLAIIMGLTGSIQITLLLIGISLIFTVIVMPALVVYDRAMKSGKQVNSIYLSVGASTLSLLITYFIFQTSVLGFIEEIRNMLEMF